MIAAARSAIGRASRIVSFSGAGLSAESGVPTFRGAQSGLWAKFDPMRLASPEGFRDDPDAVIDWYNGRRRTLAGARPNAAHLALAARPDILNITQNVDNLLERAGVASENLIHLHGTIAADRCHSSNCMFNEEVDLTDPKPLRTCPKCGSSMRPAVVWFGETLPMREWQRAAEACSMCDVLLVVGTSAAVYPAAGLIQTAREHGAAIIIVNAESCEASHLADVEILGRAGEVLPQLLAR